MFLEYLPIVATVAMGTISCFFPVALSTAAGMRQINPILIRVGRSFRARSARSRPPQR